MWSTKQETFKVKNIGKLEDFFLESVFWISGLLTSASLHHQESVYNWMVWLQTKWWLLYSYTIGSFIHSQNSS